MPRRRQLIIRAALAIVASVAAVAAVFGGEVLYAIYGFPPGRPFSNPSPDPVHIGHGPPLRFVVIGDSTAAGQGADYSTGIAMGCARHLAHTHTVSLVNLAVSGATSEEVARNQVAAACKLAPYIVFIAAGANDATHFVPSSRVRSAAATIVGRLRALPRRPEVVVTGSPDLGAAPRFAQPLRWFAGTQARRVSRCWHHAAIRHGAIEAPVIAVGPAFRRDPSLYDVDCFHPNNRGYAAWQPVLDRALVDATVRLARRLRL